MSYTAGIVLQQSGAQVVGDPRMEILFRSEALKDVDVFHEESAFAKAPARQPLPISLRLIGEG